VNERTLQLAVLQNWRSSLACAAPNYTPSDWWECDVWGVTKAGYWVEWECKISLADFRADADKARNKLVVHSPGNWEHTSERKHDLVPTGAGPSRFWYVVPHDLEIPESELPAWAGLVSVKPYSPNYSRVRIIKQAPKLGKNKTTLREIRLAQSRMWFRYWECLRVMNQRDIEEPLCEPKAENGGSES
jgi:hypothetical protein